MYNVSVAFVSRGAPARVDLTAAIARGELQPIYCLHGPERYLIDRTVTALKRALTSGPAAAFSAFNVDIYDLNDVELVKVLAAARTLPMMAERRLVIARGLETLKADELAPLVDYVASPSPSTCLVLIGEKLDTRVKAFQALKKAGALHEFAALRDRELPAWIAAEARARKLSIDGAAAAALSEIAGPDLGRVAQALEQLALYVGDAASIRLEDVEALIAETRERSVFELTRAISEANTGRALAVLANMFRNREPPLRIEAMLARQVRQICRAKELLAQNADRAEIASSLGVPPFFLDEILGPARRMSLLALTRAIERLHATDRALKSSRVDGELLMSRLVQQLADDARGPARNARN